MKSQRRNNQSKRKSQKKSQQNNNNNNNNNRKQKQKKSQQNKRSQRRSRNNSRNSNSKKSSQKQRKYKNQQRVQVQRKRKYNRSKSQRRSRSKNSQRGGYGSLDYSVIPCKEGAGGVSVPDFDSAADASPKICSNNLDMVRDAEVSVADGVSTLSGLSNFVKGGTTQVIDSSEDASGRGLSAADTLKLMDNIADETKYRELDTLDGEEGRQTRSSGEATEYSTLGGAESSRWGRLTDRGVTGEGAMFEERVAYSAPQ
jgi:hypothetical protein